MNQAPSHAASQTRALWILAVLAVLAALRLAASFLIPIVLGVLFSLALEPVVAWLVRHGLPRLAATALVLTVLLGGLGAGIYAMKDGVVSGIQALPQALRRAEAMVQEQLEAAGVPTATSPSAPSADSSDPPAAQSAATPSAPSPRAPSPPPGANDPGASPGQVLPDAISSATAAAQRGAQTLMAGAGQLMVIVFLMFFLLHAGPETGQRIVAMAGDDERRRVVATIMNDVNEQIQRFLLVRLITSAAVAAATWGVLAWLGADNAVIWGLLAGLFNSIPYFGPVIVSGGLFVVGMVQGGAGEALRMAGAALVITSLEGWLLTPPLMGRAERMNVLSVFIGLLLWTWLWGAWGTLLAVPMLAVMKSVADHVESLKPVGRLMAVNLDGDAGPT